MFTAFLDLICAKQKNIYTQLFIFAYRSCIYRKYLFICFTSIEFDVWFSYFFSLMPLGHFGDSTANPFAMQSECSLSSVSTQSPESLREDFIYKGFAMLCDSTEILRRLRWDCAETALRIIRSGVAVKVAKCEIAINTLIKSLRKREIGRLKICRHIGQEFLNFTNVE